MLLKRLKRILMSASALLALGSPSFAACPTATSIALKVAVTPTFAPTLADISDAFSLAANADPANFDANNCALAKYSVVFDTDADSNFANAIVGVTPVVYDLLLSVGPAIPKQLSVSYPTFVVGAPFGYAGDVLEFYSGEALPTNISRGLPSKWSLKAFSIPDPKAPDPYGVAAKQVLDEKANVDLGWAISKNLAQLQPDAATSAAWVDFTPGAYGFTGKSQICDARSGSEVYAGSYHHEFRPSSDYKTDIVLTGIEIARTAARSAAEEAALKKFIGFLTGKTPISVPTADATGVVSISGASSLRDHCYRVLP